MQRLRLVGDALRAGFTGLDRAKTEARQAISIVESQLKFLDQAECLQRNETSARVDLVCSSNLDRASQIRIADEELKYLQQLSSKEKTMEVKRECFRSRKELFLTSRFCIER